MTVITPEMAETVHRLLYACDAPRCGEPWKWHDPATGQRYCDPCAALGWGHCGTRCADAENTPPRRLYATDTLGEYTPLFVYLDRNPDKYGEPIAVGEIVHDSPPAEPLGGLDETTETAMARFDAAHDAQPQPEDEDGET